MSAPRLDTLFLAMPVSWKGTLQQYVGRLHRLHHGKRLVQVYDYVDNLVPMLARMYQRRLKGYAAFGYVITDAPPRHSPMMSRNENGGDIRQEGFCDSLNSIERGRV
jgi:superfamily II DNA or RNA helicase